MKLTRSWSLTKLTRSPELCSVASPEDGNAGEERGIWHYLVVDPHGIRARLEPRYSRGTKNNDTYFRYREGTIVTIERRRRGGWTKWLSCSEGWLFDVSPKDKSVRMLEVDVAHGDW